MPLKPRRHQPDGGPLVPVRFALPAAVYDYLKHYTSPRHPTVSDVLRARILEEFDAYSRLVSRAKSDAFLGDAAQRQEPWKLLPVGIQHIAKVQRQHPLLTLAQLSLLLYRERIYQHYDFATGSHTPVDSVTLSVWLRQAREAGLLS
jgi:hypothetical protein